MTGAGSLERGALSALLSGSPNLSFGPQLFGTGARLTGVCHTKRCGFVILAAKPSRDSCPHLQVLCPRLASPFAFTTSSSPSPWRPLLSCCPRRQQPQVWHGRSLTAYHRLSFPCNRPNCLVHGSHLGRISIPTLKSAAK